jgi:hypothetical protein
LLLLLLQGVLRRIISRRMVEPQRRFFDLHRLYMNKHIARVRRAAGCRQRLLVAVELRALTLSFLYAHSVIMQLPWQSNA